MKELPKRIHITGGPGGGKTTLALRLAPLLDVPVHDLDGMALDFIAKMPKPTDLLALTALREAECERLVLSEQWISDGVFLGGSETCCRCADLVVWLDVPWRVASYRILSRHVKLSIARRNRFPGLLTLYRFWRWCSRYYHDRNPWGLNDFGAPNTRAYLKEKLAKYADKLVVCRRKADIEQLVATFRK